MSENAISSGPGVPDIQGPRTHDGQPPSLQSAPPLPTTPTFDAGTVKACSDAVDRFRTGACNRNEATFNIYEALRGIAQILKATVIQASQAFVGMLDSWERSQRAAHERGTRTNGHDADSNSGATAMPTVMQPTQVESAMPECDPRMFVGTKRRRAESFDSDDDERSTRKRPLNMSELPWFEEGENDTSLLPESLEHTRRLIMHFADEPRRWKTYFTNRRDCPQFPDSEWTNIIAGKAVNLDAVHTSLFSVSVEPKHKEKFGCLSIAFDDITPSKTVKMHGDWLAAWERASTTITFIFQHRASELNGYRSHISQLFTVLGPSMPDPVRGVPVTKKHSVQQIAGGTLQ